MNEKLSFGRNLSLEESAVAKSLGLGGIFKTGKSKILEVHTICSNCKNIHTETAVMLEYSDRTWLEDLDDKVPDTNIIEQSYVKREFCPKCYSLQTSKINELIAYYKRSLYNEYRYMMNTTKNKSATYEALEPIVKRLAMLIGSPMQWEELMPESLRKALGK